MKNNRLQNNQIEVVNATSPLAKYQMFLHENSVFSLKYANSGKWFFSTSRDKSLATWKSPFGPSLFQCKEPSSIFCSDISKDDSLLVTGSAEKVASIYEVVF